MVDRLKTLGLAFVAVLVIGAAVSSAARAGQFTPNEFSADLTGEQTEFEGSKLHVIMIGLSKFSCSKATFTSTITSGAKSTTVTPTYEECNYATFPVTTTMNGCDYFYNEPVAGGGAFTGTTNLDCPSEKVVETHIYINAANHFSGISACTITFIPFKGLGTVTYDNVAASGGHPDHLTLTTKITKIPIKIHMGSPLACGTSITATYTGATTVKAYKAGQAHTTENQLGLTVS